MSRKLHKTAQPLTILQGLLDLMLTNVANGGEGTECRESSGPQANEIANCDQCKIFLERASEEVRRLASCFEDVRNLAGLKQPTRDNASVSLSHLVADVVRNLKSDLAAAGIKVVFDEGSHGDATTVVVTSPTRVFAGFRMILSALADCLPAGEQIKVSMGTRDAAGDITIRTSGHGRFTDDLASALGTELECAQLLFASVGGKLSLNPTRDIVAISLTVEVSRPASEQARTEAVHV
jgi:hypothetical protein